MTIHVSDRTHKTRIIIKSSFFAPLLLLNTALAIFCVAKAFGSETATTSSAKPSSADTGEIQKSFSESNKKSEQPSLSAKDKKRFLRFFEQLRHKVTTMPEQVDPNSIISELRRMKYHHPGLMSTCRDGYQWRLDFHSSLVAKPLDDDNWEISTEHSQLALIQPNDVKLFIFEKEIMQEELPQQLSRDTAILLFAKRFVIVITPAQHFYADLPWSWRNPYPHGPD